MSSWPHCCCIDSFACTDEYQSSINGSDGLSDVGLEESAPALESVDESNHKTNARLDSVAESDILREFDGEEEEGTRDKQGGEGDDLDLMDELVGQQFEVLDTAEASPGKQESGNGVVESESSSADVAKGMHACTLLF